ncbi:lipopolysaccharide biosynthesis protein [Lutimonas vermicola]|uniref:Lipopolysaccharide biosynthesis protein n=1 Tax=Lutimonas vermicola TaxID=414288 RepID=A0ABU9L409_9FLAO
MSELNKKVANATKWSSLTEIAAKLIAPITTMVLARLLTPEAFGVVATVTMIISFTQIFSDAGFQKYLIQYEFENDDDKYKTTNVAFLSNLAISLILWGIIIVFRESLANMVGNPGLGNVIAIACVSIPLAAFSSIQVALYKRSFDFKTLFYVRLAGILIPLVITIPLAIFLKNYWALIIGTILVHTSNAIILTIKSKWKPNGYYSIKRLKKMLSFSSWVLFDTVLVWATSYIDIFIIGVTLNEYYLGLYKTSITTVGQITAIITATILPIMLPTLSRLQNDKEELKKMLLKFQKMTSIILIPLGVGIFMFSDLITLILLGEQWTEASDFIGIWGLMSAITIIFSRFSTIIYPAVGKPRMSVVAQLLHLVVLIPAIIFSADYGFEVLFWVRSLVRFELIFVNLIITYYLVTLSPWKMLRNIAPELLVSVFMGIVAYLLLQIHSSIVWSFSTISICIVVYFMSLAIFPKEKQIILKLVNQVYKRIGRK